MNQKKSTITHNADGVDFAIYRTTKQTKSGSKDYWLLADYSSGKRRLLSHTSEKDARQHANKIRGAMVRGQASRMSLSNGQWQDVCIALEILRSVRSGDSLHSAVKDWAVCMGMLDGRATLLEAVRFYLSNHNGGGPFPVRASFRDAAQRYYESKVKSGMSKGHCKNITGRLKRLEKMLPSGVSLDELTAGQLDSTVLGFEIKEKTRNEYRAVLSNFYIWAAKQNPPYVPRQFNPAKQMERHKAKHREAEFLPVGELRKILTAATEKRPDLLPLITLVCFAGLRPSEAVRLDWVEVGTDYIRLPGKKSKTGYSRQIPIQENLKCWVALWRKSEGPVSPSIDLAHVNQRIAEFSGVALSHDSLRHSFGTYRQKIVKNVGAVSDEMGNSAAICRRHYLNAFCTDVEARGMVQHRAHKCVKYHSDAERQLQPEKHGCQ